ncbi:CoA ligase [Pseudacidovorax intermedius]|uniref:Long-chain-fatty-acid--CoA ligase n=2 Tax=Pseudacidovorax intermedius TaxID=433924 RepID=A0A147GQS1_9BURK|nr:CoA ligase [Pseudacidovorax intermedius]
MRPDDAPARLAPLLGPRDLHAPLAWRQGRPISGLAWLADVEAVARQLPAEGPAVNLCGDRYRFSVGLAAALVRGHASLLPPDAREDTLARVCAEHPAAFALVDPGETHGASLALRVAVDADGSRPPLNAMPDWAAIDSARHAASLLTSGSTGTPQPHAKTWGTLVGDVAAAAPRLCQLLGLPSLAGLTLVATVPVQHSYGLESSALLAMLGGAAFEAGRPFYPADIVQALEAVPRPRALVTTPFHLKTLLQSGLPIPPVDLLLSATAPLSPQLAAQAERATGGVMAEIYGSTETGQVALRCPVRSEVWAVLGDIRVQAEPAPDGGERFVFSGDFIPAPTPMADLLELLGDGRFRLLGRANDLVHVAGRRTSLGHLDFHLNSIPGVEDGAFWLPDDVADGVVRTVAFVVAPQLDAAAVIAGLRERIEPVFVPRRVVHVQALPRVGTGKLTRRELREFALAQLAADGSPVRLSHRVPADHPAFAGHFPGRPLLPGALLLAELLEAMRGVPALRARLGEAPTLAAAKFLAPVRPGADLVFDLQPESGAAGGVRFEVRSGDTVAASGRWLPGEGARGAAAGGAP